MNYRNQGGNGIHGYRIQGGDSTLARSERNRLPLLAGINLELSADELFGWLKMN